MTADFAVVLPCYNEEGNIPAILDRYRMVRQRSHFELILVDNGSTDGTGAMIQSHLSRPENAFVRMVRVRVNKGYGNGIKMGLKETTAPVVSFSHADLQCPPEDPATAYDIFQRANGRCLVKGRRCGRRAFLDRVVTWFYNRMAHALLGLATDQGAVPDINAEPKLFNRALLDDLAAAPDDFTFDLFVLWAARRRNIPVVEFEVAYEARNWGKSKLAANPLVRMKTSARAFLKILELRHKK